MSQSFVATNSRPTVRVVADRREGECVVADELEVLLRAQPAAVLGLATGGTMTGLYAELAARHASGFSRVIEGPG